MPAHFHPWTRRHLRLTIRLAIASVAIPLVFVAVVIVWYRNSPAEAVLPYVGFFGLIAVAQVLWTVPVRKRVLAHKGRLCGNCLFPFKGLPDQGTCPECGNTYDADETVRGWETDFRVTLAPTDSASPDSAQSPDSPDPRDPESPETNATSAR